jgi:hypothetical protein
MSAYKASALTGVPQSTIKDNKSKLVDHLKLKSGPEPMLGNENEAKLKEFLMERADAAKTFYFWHQMLDISQSVCQKESNFLKSGCMKGSLRDIKISRLSYQGNWR